MGTFNGKSGSDFLKGSTSADKILGFSGNDSLFGFSGDDVIDGGDGNDTVDGGDGNDKLAGGNGNDRLLGGNGNDVLSDFSGTDLFSGGAGYDTLDYSGMKTGRGVDVYLTLGIGGRDASGDTYSGIENVTGTQFQDFLWGASTNNVLNGGAGNDFMRGFAGNDTFLGGAGNDEMYGDDGYDLFRPGYGQDIIDGGASSDWMDFTDIGSKIVVDFNKNTFSGPLQKWGSADGDQVYNVEGLRATNFDDNIDLNGAAGWMSFTTVDGGKGNDTLSGASTFFGGMGEDTVRLTAGKAQWVVLQRDMGIDKIVNFDTADGDKLAVSRSQFGLKTDTSGNTIFNWVDTTDAPHALTIGPAFIYETTTQILWFDADGTASKSAPIALAGFYSPANAVTASDLVFIG